MDIRILPLGPIETNAFLLTDGADAVLIDAPMGAFDAVGEVLARSGATLGALLLTHGHWDHTTDAHRFQAAGVPLHGHAGDRELFENPAVMAPFLIPGVPLEPVRIDHWVEEGRPLGVLGKAVEVRHVPGHAPGNVLFHFPEQSACFSGDALFAGGIGRYDLPGGDFTTLEDSIRRKIYTLPEDTEIYPGHGPVTSVREEKRRNPFVRGG
ncbi:MAG: MBL fold metallo-hydrolase [Puniceicoccaceae bacterium]